MCFDSDSLPPVPVLAGGALTHEDLVLEASDGARLAAASGHGLGGAVGFYGRPGRGQDGSPGPAQLADRMEAPILALQAGADQNITGDDNAAFEDALRAAGVEHELVSYEGAPHSFFDRKQAEFAEASADAWQRVLDFIERHR